MKSVSADELASSALHEGQDEGSEEEDRVVDAQVEPRGVAESATDTQGVRSQIWADTQCIYQPLFSRYSGYTQPNLG